MYTRTYRYPGCLVQVRFQEGKRAFYINKVLVGEITQHKKGLYRAPDGARGDRLGVTVRGYLERQGLIKKEASEQETRDRVSN